jgi:predicted TIM-barrel fold metal-dependent hydrolase
MTEFCQAPDPDARAPRVRIPPLATDTHFHILGPASEYPYVEDREYTPPDALPEHCRHLFHTLGIERAVLVQPSVYGYDNRRMLAAASQLGVPTRNVVVVAQETSDKEMERLHDTGTRGIRFISAHKGGLSLAQLEQISERVKGLGWHIQLLLRPPVLVELEPRLAKLSTDFVIDHIGLIRASDGGIEQPAFQALQRLIRTGRCWVKFTGGYRVSSEKPPFQDVIPLAHALVRERPDRILWGSDWPHVMVKENMPNTTDLLDLLSDWAPDEKTREQILVENPQKLFDF